MQVQVPWYRNWRTYTAGAAIDGAVALGIRGCGGRAQPYPTLDGRRDVLTVETVEIDPVYSSDGYPLGGVVYVTARNGEGEVKSYPMKLSTSDAGDFGIRKGEKVIEDTRIRPDNEGFYRTPMVLQDLRRSFLEPRTHRPIVIRHPRDKAPFYPEGP